MRRCREAGCGSASEWSRPGCPRLDAHKLNRTGRPAADAATRTASISTCPMTDGLQSCPTVPRRSRRGLGGTDKSAPAATRRAPPQSRTHHSRPPPMNHRPYRATRHTRGEQQKPTVAPVGRVGDDWNSAYDQTADHTDAPGASTVRVRLSPSSRFLRRGRARPNPGASTFWVAVLTGLHLGHLQPHSADALRLAPDGGPSSGSQILADGTPPPRPELCRHGWP